MTKADVIAEIAEKTGIDKADVTTSIEAFFSVVKNSMSNGEKIYGRGLGSFVNKKRARKIARNISKNTAIIIDEHYIPSFKPSKVFVEKIKSSDRVKALNSKRVLPVILGYVGLSIDSNGRGTGNGGCFVPVT